MKHFTSKTQKTGEIGEGLAARYLAKHGFVILERNFTCRMGEIDVIAKKSDSLHFVEVKTARGVYGKGGVEPYYRAEENLHHKKLRRICRTVEYYTLAQGLADSQEWQIDLCMVYYDQTAKVAQVSMLWNIIV